MAITISSMVSKRKKKRTKWATKQCFKTRARCTTVTSRWTRSRNTSRMCNSFSFDSSVMGTCVSSVCIFCSQGRQRDNQDVREQQGKAHHRRRRSNSDDDPRETDQGRRDHQGRRGEDHIRYSCVGGTFSERVTPVLLGDFLSSLSRTFRDEAASERERERESAYRGDRMSLVGASLSLLLLLLYIVNYFYCFSKFWFYK